MRKFKYKYYFKTKLKNYSTKKNKFLITYVTV